MADGVSGVHIVGVHGRSLWLVSRAVALMRRHAGPRRVRSAAGARAAERLEEFNESLLSRLGGSLLAPPQLEPGWPERSEVRGARDEGRARFLDVHGATPWIWAERRNCLLQPFWDETLDGRPLVLLVHRRPEEVSDAFLRQRKIAAPAALAIWERYLRVALRNAEGLPAFVLPHAGLLDSPATWARDVAAFLADRNVDCDPDGGSEAVVRFVGSHRRADTAPTAAAEHPLSEPQLELAARLEALAGTHARLEPVALPSETASTEPLLAERRAVARARAGQGGRNLSRGDGPGAKNDTGEKRPRERTPAGRVRRAAAGVAGRDRRRPAAPATAGGALPDFVIIGGQKCGTTSLFRWIGESPAVELPMRKEAHFFTSQFELGVDWYRSRFPSHGRRRRGPITGEASTSYMHHPLAAERLASVVPNARLIALLRDPVERAVSGYWHEVRKGREHLDLMTALDEEDERLAGDAGRVASEPGYRSFAGEHYGYRTRGLYAEQLRGWLSVFPADQLLVVESGRLFASPRDELRRVCAFLGVSEEPVGDLSPRNSPPRPATPPEVEERLRAEFAEPNARLYELLGDDLGW